MSAFGEQVVDVTDSRLDSFRDLRRHKPSKAEILVDGLQSVVQLLKSGFAVERLLLQPTALTELRPTLEACAEGRSAGRGPALADVVVCDVSLIEEVTGIHVPARGELAFAIARRPVQPQTLDEAFPTLAHQDSAGRPFRVLALDGLTDAANVGHLVRVAVGFGASAVLCSSDCCDPFHTKAVRASMGRVFHVPVLKRPLAETLRELRERWSVLTAAAVVQEGARFLDEVPSVPQHWALVVGSEHFGVSTAVREVCKLLVKIRMAPNVDSLNVVVSAGVLLHGCAEREASAAKLVDATGSPDAAGACA